MSDVRASERGNVQRPSSQQWRDRSAPARRPSGGGLSPGMVVAGVAALALGALAIYHFGPDFRRYLKMEMM